MKITIDISQQELLELQKSMMDYVVKTAPHTASDLMIGFWSKFFELSKKQFYDIKQ